MHVASAFNHCGTRTQDHVSCAVKAEQEAATYKGDDTHKLAMLWNLRSNEKARDSIKNEITQNLCFS
jgi:uncharacterized protein Yka (UPF0111/DUF47 family)